MTTNFKIYGHINGNRLNKTVSVQTSLISAVEAEMASILGDLKKVIGKKVLVAGEKVAYYHTDKVYIEITKIR